MTTKPNQAARHVLLTPQTCPCDKTSDSPCPVCDGGLAICSVCKKAEIELDEPCVFPAESQDKGAAVKFKRILKCHSCGKTQGSNSFECSACGSLVTEIVLPKELQGEPVQAQTGDERNVCE